MPTLTSGQVDTLHGTVMAELSSLGFTTDDVTKAQLRNGIVKGDVALDDAESAWVSSISAGPAKTWLLANTGTGRFILELVETERRKVL